MEVISKASTFPLNPQIISLKYWRESIIFIILTRLIFHRDT